MFENIVMKKMLFVINPISGGAEKEDAKQLIEQWWERQGIDARWHETTGEDDAGKLGQQLEQDSPDAVVACGGDGTINLVGRTLLNKDVPMGIIPLGSANGLATDLCISDNVPQALDVLARPRVKAIDVLRINGEYYSFHLADLGYNARLIEEFESTPERGKLDYARSFLHVARNRPLSHFTVTTAGRQIKRKSVMAAFANAQRYGTGAVINPNGRLDDGKFELCLFLPWPRWYLAWMTLLFFIGQINKSRYVKIISCDELTLRSEEALPLQIDGELIGNCREVKVEVLPQRVKVLMPGD